MKLKNILLVVFISATTAILSVWGYAKFADHNSSTGIQQDNGKLPVNYAGFFDKEVMCRLVRLILLLLQLLQPLL
jgi:hypothetical protein